MEDSIIVIGSKPNAIIPKRCYSKIYTANGACERGAKLRFENKNSKLIAVVGGREFIGNKIVNERIVKSHPEHIYVRGAKINPTKFFNYEASITNVWNFEQIIFQKNFFRFGIFSLYLGELRYEKKIKDKFIHFFKCIFKKKLWGISTGFYTILLALNENTEHDIIISGIGMSGGKQYYPNERNKTLDYTPRSRVDKFLISMLKDQFKKRLLTTDVNLSHVANIRYLI